MTRPQSSPARPCQQIWHRNPPSHKSVTPCLQLIFHVPLLTFSLVTPVLFSSFSVVLSFSSTGRAIPCPTTVKNAGLSFHRRGPSVPLAEQRSSHTSNPLN